MADDTRKAMLIVASCARDVAECRELLAMLGLAAPERKRKPGRPSVDHGHGDHRTYNKGCRCGDCREAFRLYCVEARARWRADPSSADRAGHGKPSTYKNYGCRCASCTAANTADVNAYKARRRQRVALAETGGT